MSGSQKVCIVIRHRAYFAVVRHLGKLIRKSLATDDRALAKRRLVDFRRTLDRVDHKAGKVTVAELATRYLATVQHLAENSLLGKRAITGRIVDEWPDGSSMFVKDVRESHVRTWLGVQSQRLGKSAYNSYLQHIRAMFRLAVADRIIADSPVAEIKQVKRDLPIRNTPTDEEFRAIVESIREQRLHAEADDSADFVEFLGLSGLGNAEASSLTWGDVDFEKRKIRAYRHKTDVGFMVPIFPQLGPLLDRLHGSGGQAPMSGSCASKTQRKASLRPASDSGCPTTLTARFAACSSREPSSAASMFRSSLPGKDTATVGNSSSRPTATFASFTPIRWRNY